MTQIFPGFVAFAACLFAIIMMLRNGFGNKAGIDFGFVIFLFIGTQSAIIGNVMNNDTRSE